MNLIEQFGGYENAKSMCDHINGPLGLITDGYSHYTKAMVVDALLEYRRDNNVFEVGDFVVDTEGFFDWLCKVDYLSTDGRVVMYKHDQRRGDTAFSTWPPIRRVRHANPQEIEAGRRL